MNNKVYDDTEHMPGTTKSWRVGKGLYKSLQNDLCSVAPSGENLVLKTNPREKAEITKKNHFLSVFTKGCRFFLSRTLGKCHQ